MKRKHAKHVVQGSRRVGDTAPESAGAAAERRLMKVD